jgi:excinuclease ABC subunit B
LAKEIKQLEKMMVDHAKNLEFEKAAQARDQLLKLKAMVFGAELHDTIQLNGN